MTKKRPESRTSSKASGSLARRLPGSIWALGFVSMLMDVSSELIHSLLPVFMVATLGASMMTVGIIEGAAEATASIMKLFSGAVSDARQKRKGIAVLGYGLAALTKPMFPLATSVAWVFVARFTDRVGKGIRGAPRDALIAEIAPPHMRGAAYGLRQSLDSIGAFVGPAAAILLMAFLADDVRSVLWVAVIPAVASVLVLQFFVHEPESTAPAVTVRSMLVFRQAGGLMQRYWFVVFLGALFTLARFSGAFLILRGQDVGLGARWAPLMLIVMNVVYAASAYPAGRLSDRLGPTTILIAGLGVLVGADILLAAASSPLVATLGAAVWGLHMGMTQGLTARLVADTAPKHLRGTAFGIFHLVGGIAVLAANLIAGAVWKTHGAAATFALGAGFATLAAAGIFLRRKSIRAAPESALQGSAAEER